MLACGAGVGEAGAGVDPEAIAIVSFVSAQKSTRNRSCSAVGSSPNLAP